MILLLTALLIYCAVYYVQAARHGKAVLEDLSIQPTAPALGETVKLRTVCFLPWGQELQDVKFQPGNGTVQQGTAGISSGAWSQHGRKILIDIALCAYRPGKLPGGTLTVDIQRPYAVDVPRKITLSQTAPELDVKVLQIADRDRLMLADTLFKPESSNTRYYWIAGSVLAVILLAVLLWKLFRKRRKPEIILPPWIRARRDLDELRSTASSGGKSLEWCIVRLTDVVRDYLSERFALPICQQTTSEFFASLKKKQSPLSRNQICYLEDFLTSADLVKFANVKTNSDDFTLAVDRAEELISETAVIVNTAPTPAKERVK